MVEEANFSEVANLMLSDAIMESHSFREVELALALGANPNGRLTVTVTRNNVESKKLTPPLIASLLIPDLDWRIADALLRNGADAKYYAEKDASGPIHFAAASGSPRTLRAIANAPGVLINQADERGFTPLIYSVEARRSLNMRVLLDAGADPDYGGPQKILPVIEAVKKNSDVLLSVLFEYNASPDVLDSDHSAPLHYAAFLDNEFIIKMLVGRHANLEAKNASGQTPLLIACSKDNTQAAMSLIDAKANVNAQDLSGNTPLILAVIADNLELCKKLLEEKASPFISDVTNKNALHYAQTSGNRSLKNLFEGYGRASELKAVARGPAATGTSQRRKLAS